MQIKDFVLECQYLTSDNPDTLELVFFLEYLSLVTAAEFVAP